MFDFLPRSLQALYRALIDALPYAPGTRVKPLPPEPDLPPPGGKQRLLRLNIVQDAFCQHLPKPRKLFRAPQAPRDATSWCDAPNAWTGRQKPRCSDCEHAHATYRAACKGDWKAECRLHRLAVRAARRLAGRRREYYAYRRARGAIRRQERLVRQRRFGVEEQPLEFPFCRRPSSGGAHHIIDRRAEEAELVRAQMRSLHRTIRKRRARLRDRERAREQVRERDRDAAREPDAAHPSPVTAAPAAMTGATAGPDPVRSRNKTPPHTADDGAIKVGAARWTIPGPPRPAPPSPPAAAPSPSTGGAMALACSPHERRASTGSMSSPLIGVTLDSEQPGGYSKYPWYALRNHYADAVAAAGGLPVALPHHAALAEDYLDRLDALIVTGGAFDVDPALYGDADRHATVILKETRTGAELALLRGALARDLPVLGICGGQQLLAVALGGTLIQHIPDTIQAALPHEQPNPRHEPGHAIAIAPGTLLARITGQTAMQVNSSHHQAVRTAGPHAVVSATAPDGVIEAIEAPGHSFCLGVQWHPEFLIDPGDARIFAAFITAAQRK
jgi:putative glutamine amidotransferase